MPAKKAVLLLQMGGPDSIDAVEPFLLNLFSDREIIKIGPAWLQPIIARFIVKKRKAHVEDNYALIGGKSPLRQLTEDQAASLEKLLCGDYRCFVAMRYWRPSTLEALAEIRRAGITNITALSLYPHYSRATTGSSIKELKRVLAEAKSACSVKYIDSFYNNTGYIDALEEKIREGLAQFHPLADVELLFSAHSLPQSFIDEGDPYLQHVSESVRLVMERFELPHHLSFQSRAGPVKWLEPSTDDMLKRLAGSGVKNLLVIPLSFVSDHIETLHEIDIEYSKKAWELGIVKFERMPSLNSSPTFIAALAQLVRTAQSE
ncbi:MAG: ferrochelatase [Deltaproteobacteria bacterium HGW-Deltaproteobacteria-23]|nr:MAG: ferrochelatase [Deltaproteobacteria bacterium HGW-Deltaproteobacteria-23]